MSGFGRDHAEEECNIEIDRVRSEMKASSALDLEGKERQLSASHAMELKGLRTELQQSSAEIERRSDAEEEREEATNRVRSEMEALSALDLEETERQLLVGVHQGVSRR